MPIKPAICTYDHVDASNTVYYGHELPAASFVKFKARRLRNARVVWINHALIHDLGITVPPTQAELEQQVLDAFAWMVPASNDLADDFLEAEREFLGERYGTNARIAANGGGVRCGLNGYFQVKGIGRNPLAGKGGDVWHTHGGASVEEGLREAIWGELTHAEMPFGGIRILAVISAGKATHYDFGLVGNQGGDVPEGALIVREPNIRPAHFERAPFFRPLEGVEMVADVDRVRDVFKCLHLSAPGADAADPAESLSQAQFMDVLEALNRRFATQHAAARARRVVHGAITSSNIEITGKYIDFGTMTLFSGYGNYQVARGLPAFWDDHWQSAHVVGSLFYYGRKYLPGSHGWLTGVDDNQFQDPFVTLFDAEMQKQMIHMAGFPMFIVEAVKDYDATFELARRAYEVGRLGGMKSQPLQTVPERMGSCDLPRVLTLAAQGQWGQIAAEGALPDEHLLDCFKTAYLDYHRLATLVARRHGIAAPAFATMVEINAATRNKRTPGLYRDVMMGRSDQVIRDTRHAQDGAVAVVNQYMDDVLSQGRRFFGDDTQVSVAAYHQIDAGKLAAQRGWHAPRAQTFVALGGATLDLHPVQSVADVAQRWSFQVDGAAIDAADIELTADARLRLWLRPGLDARQPVQVEIRPRDAVSAPTVFAL